MQESDESGYVRATIEDAKRRAAPLTLKQWMIDMTGPEDAWAREQYATLVEAAKEALPLIGWVQLTKNLRDALKAAGEIE